MPNLRGHHLICLHFFSGEGYNPGFIENLHNVLREAEEEEVRVLFGGDDVCGKCPSQDNSLCRYSENSDIEIKTMDEKTLDLLDLSIGDIIGWKDIRGKIPGIFQEWHRTYCMACGWKKACEKNDSYRELKTYGRDSSHPL